MKEIVQLGPNDLHLYPRAGQTQEDRLNELLTEFLLDAKEIIDLDRRRDYEAEVLAGTRAAVPRGIVRAAYMLAANMVILTKEYQKAGQFQNDTFDGSSLVTEAFSPEIAAELLLYPAGLNFRMKRVRTRQEIEEAVTAQ